MHIVAQVNHEGLGVKVETNCLRNSDLIPFLKLGPNEKSVKGMQIRKQGGVRKRITYPISGKIHAEMQVLGEWGSQSKNWAKVMQRDGVGGASPKLGSIF